MDKKSRRLFLQQAGAASLLVPLAGFTSAEEKPTLLRAPRLKPGNTIALTAPAGAIFNEESITKAVTALEAAGFKVKTGDTLKARYGYLAGEDAFRAKELNALFSDSSVHAIMAMRGGWGCARLLPLIDFENIRKHPKIITGFSDITTLLLALHHKTGLVTFHGPVGNSSLGEFTMQQFLRVVQRGEAATLQQPEGDPVITITPGKARGVLAGGNLTVLCSLMGTGYLPDWENKILFVEETEEEPYSIDRLLTQLKLAGVLQKLSGFIFGKCTKCEAEEPEKSLTLQQVLNDHIRPLKVPAFFGSSFGHVRDKLTLPLGTEAEIDAASGTIRLLQASVS